LAHFRAVALDCHRSVFILMFVFIRNCHCLGRLLVYTRYISYLV